jgi:uncharacterized protein with HEPN domain
MADDDLALLDDIRRAAAAILAFVRGKSFSEYQADEMLRSAIERKFEIIGEALNRLRKTRPELLPRIREQRSIISFRNILVHGYDRIDDEIVWGIIEEDLANLLADVEQLLSEAGKPD